MSVVRFSPNSNIYIYHSVHGGIECYGCLLNKDFNSVNYKTGKEMADHVRKHIAAGHKVPDYVIPELENEK